MAIHLFQRKVHAVSGNDDISNQITCSHAGYTPTNSDEEGGNLHNRAEYAESEHYVCAPTCRKYCPDRAVERLDKSHRREKSDDFDNRSPFFAQRHQDKWFAKNEQPCHHWSSKERDHGE